MRFSETGDLITRKSIEISFSKIWPKNNSFSTITWVRENKKGQYFTIDSKKIKVQRYKLIIKRAADDQQKKFVFSDETFFQIKQD